MTATASPAAAAPAAPAPSSASPEAPAAPASAPPAAPAPAPEPGPTASLEQTRANLIQQIQAGMGQTPDPAPQITDPAPQITDPAPQITDPAPQITDPAPQITDPAPRTTDPTETAMAQLREQWRVEKLEREAAEARADAERWRQFQSQRTTDPLAAADAAGLSYDDHTRAWLEQNGTEEEKEKARLEREITELKEFKAQYEREKEARSAEDKMAQIQRGIREAIQKPEFSVLQKLDKDGQAVQTIMAQHAQLQINQGIQQPQLLPFEHAAQQAQNALIEHYRGLLPVLKAIPEFAELFGAPQAPAPTPAAPQPPAAAAAPEPPAPAHEPVGRNWPSAGDARQATSQPETIHDVVARNRQALLAKLSAG